MNYWQRLETLGIHVPYIQTLDIYPGTSCYRLDGRLVAEALLEQVKACSVNRIKPHLSVILIGDNPASQTYVLNKQKSFTKAGFSSDVLHWSASETTTEKLLEKIEELNQNKNVHGILVQLPLPPHIEAKRVINAIRSHKDVDGFTQLNAGKLFQDDASGLLPCTPFGIITLLKAYRLEVKGKRAVVIGRSQIVGRPMAQMLMTANATVTVAHSHTVDLSSLTREADIVVAAVGQENLLNENDIKPGAIVFDVGMNRNSLQKLCGDTHTQMAQKAGWLTPVPGGVGPLTIAMLCLNTAITAWDSK